ncbi:MAG: Gfo/Idh/MocA family protein [Gemmataceae bacterium]
MLTRRSFNKTIFAGTMGAVASNNLFGAQANDRLQIGFIGVGTMGRGHLGAFLNMKEVQVVAVCDVVEERLQMAHKMVANKYTGPNSQTEFKDCKVFKDFRKLLEDKSIDAVVISTPDHWHAIPSIMAARQKKHVYCEKPLTHSIHEGRVLTSEVAKSGIVFQTGSQQRSEFGGKFRLAVQLIRAGRIGKIKTVRIGVGGPAIACNLETQDIPAGTDWDLWQGPAPMRGYNEALCPKGVHTHFPAWRSYWEYAGGGLADMGAHHFDIAQWALNMDSSGPVKITPPSNGEKTGLKFTYANGVEMFHGGPSGCTFEGSDATLYVDRNKMECTKEEILKEPLNKEDPSIIVADNHKKNWLEAIRGNKKTLCPAEVGHRSASICHLGNIGYRVGKPLEWDPAKETFTNSQEANKLLFREYRAPWKLA